MNKVILIGNMTRDPEVRYTTGGKAVATFSIAVNSGFGDNKRTEFVPIVTWEKLAEVCGNNLTKGKRILVEGRLQLREYETKEGEKRKVAEVVAQNIEFLSPRDTAYEGKPTSGSAGSAQSGFGQEVLPEEEIPF
ncbi:MAG: single-stranded DNA-binding protein [Negativicutes bacterium]|jgi:single-strand DNA-binding protein